MIRRGLTLIELLASMVLLSLLVGALYAWLHSVVDLSARQVDPAVWDGRARLALQRIREDLLVGDDPNVEAENNVLTLQSREQELGRVVVRYRLQASTGSLVRDTLSAELGDPRRTQLVLNDVHDWQVDLDDEDQRLAITVAGDGPRHLRREFQLR